MSFKRKSSNSGDLPIGIIGGRGKDEFLCILCSTGEILQDFEAHIETPRHVSAIEQSRLLFGFHEEEINSKTCDASINWTGLRKHANWHKIASSNETSVSETVGTTSEAAEEAAVACDAKLSIDARVRKNPTASNLAANLRNVNLTESVAQNNNPEVCPSDDCIMILGRCDFCCKICRILFSGQTSIQTHLQGEKHFTALRKSKETKKPRGLYYDCLSCKCSIPSLAKVPFHVFGSQHKKTSPDSNSLWKSYSRQLGRNYVARIDQEDFYCTVCDVTIFTADNLDQHLATKRHSDSLSKHGCQEFVTPRSRSDDFFCNCCDCSIPDFESLCIHVASRKHSKNVVVKRSDIEKLLKERDERWKKKNDEEKDAARKRTKKTNSASSSLILALKRGAGIVQEESYNIDLDVDSIFKMSDKLQVLVKDAGLCATEIGSDGGTEYRCMVCKKKIGRQSILVEHFHSLEHYEAYKSVREMGLNYKLVGETNSDNDLASEFLEEESEDAIHCYACDVEIDNLDEMIESHMTKKSHSEKRDWLRQRNRQIFIAAVTPNLGCDWLEIEKYFCALCDENFETELEFVRHEQSLDHEIVAKNADCLFRPLTHDFCSACSMLWYGDCVEHVRHAKTSRHNELQLLHKNSSKVSESFSDDDFITSTLKLLRVPNQWLDTNQSTILEDFKGVVAPSFPNAKIIITDTNRNLCGNGCEIFLSFGESVRSSTNRIAREIAVALGSHYQTKTISAAYKMSRVTSKKWEQVSVHENDPSNITALHLSSQYVVNVRLCKEINLDRSEFFCFLASVSENFRELERTITTLKAQALRTEDEIKNISISELIIFFLQQKSWFPPISDFIKLSEVTVNFKPGWHRMITKSDGRVTWHYKTMKVMIEFHRFWANFDYHHEAVCPWIGKTMKKRDLTNLQISRKKTNVTSEESCDFENDEFLTPLSIQSEFGLMENKTKKVSKAELIAFRRYCVFVVQSFEKGLKG